MMRLERMKDTQNTPLRTDQDATYGTTGISITGTGETTAWKESELCTTRKEERSEAVL